MQDTGDIIIRRWPGCEATIVPTGRPWNRISVARGPSLLQLFPKALTLTRPNLLGPLVTISWLPRTRAAGLHIPEGLGSIHQPAQENGAREKAELGPPRRRRSPSQTGAWSATWATWRSPRSCASTSPRPRGTGKSDVSVRLPPPPPCCLALPFALSSSLELFFNFLPFYIQSHLRSISFQRHFNTELFLALEQSLSQWYPCHLLSIRGRWGRMYTWVCSCSLIYTPAPRGYSTHFTDEAGDPSERWLTYSIVQASNELLGFKSRSVWLPIPVPLPLAQT